MHRVLSQFVNSTIYRNNSLINGNGKQNIGLIFRGYAFSVNFQLKYKDDETKRILHIINKTESNNMLNYDISKGRLEKLQNWKSKNGEFTHIEQLLELDGFGLKIIDKFYKSILKESPETLLQNQELLPVPTGKESKKRSAQKLTTPILYDEMRFTIKSCVAIHTGINNISWARLHRMENDLIQVDQWNILDLGEKKLHLSELVNFVAYANYAIPTADVYVFESPPTAQVGGQGTPIQININVQKYQLIGMISLALACRKLNEQFYAANIKNTAEIQNNEKIQFSHVNASILFLRQHLTSRLYNTIIGTERVSNETVISNLLRINYNIGDRLLDNDKLRKVKALPKLNVTDDVRRNYNDADGFHKDSMGNALLMGLTFLRLCVIQDDSALALITKKSK